MNYEEFVHALMEAVINLSEIDTTVCLHRVSRNNGVVKKVLSISRPGEDVMPTVYPERYYEKYRMGVTIPHLAYEVIAEIDQARKGCKIQSEDYAEFENMKDRVLYQLVNYDRNALNLQKQPYIRFLDLAVVFYYFLDLGSAQRATARITNSHLQKWGLSPAELWNAARVNTPKSEPADFCPIDKIVSELDQSDFSENMGDSEYSENPDIPMTVLTNRDRAYGAACMTYEGVFEDISDYYAASLFILPSSIHEVIVVPDYGKYSKDELEDMVTDINASEVSPSEVLSNHIYRYDRLKKEISLP